MLQVRCMHGERKNFFCLVINMRVIAQLINTKDERATLIADKESHAISIWAQHCLAIIKRSNWDTKKRASPGGIANGSKHNKRKAINSMRDSPSVGLHHKNRSKQLNFFSLALPIINLNKHKDSIKWSVFPSFCWQFVCVGMSFICQKSSFYVWRSPPFDFLLRLDVYAKK